MRDCGERKGRIHYIFRSWQWGRGSQKVTFELRPKVERRSLGRQGRVTACQAESGASKHERD